MVNVVRKETHEVGMHSNILASLLNPDGLHYQGDLFLKLFVEHVLSENIGENIVFEAEEYTDGARRIDFTLKSDSCYIGIEMKVNAGDLKEQIYDYHQYLSKKAAIAGVDKVMMFYLTKNGKVAPEFSKCKNQDDNISDCVDVKNIAFDKHILNWIEACQKELKEASNLYEAFNNYKDIVEKITGKSQSKIDSLDNFMLKNQEIFYISQDIYDKQRKELFDNQQDINFQEIYNGYAEARKAIVDSFFKKELIKYLRTNGYIVILEDDEKGPLLKVMDASETIIFGFGKWKNEAYYMIDDKKEDMKTPYFYTNSVRCINALYEEKGIKAKEYYLNLIKENFLK
jgi:hypothetical protein